MPKNSRPTPTPLSSVRVISGRWRGRRIEFAAIEGLRPTGDRLRETLFNWLQGELGSRRCLDLYAGSGSLGIEALSRGAAHCHFIDRERDACQHITKNIERFGGADCQVSCDDAQRWVTSYEGLPFDVLFLDPPFTDWRACDIIRAVERSKVTGPDTLVYLEYPQDYSPELPAAWLPLKTKTAGGVSAALLRASAP